MIQILLGLFGVFYVSNIHAPYRKKKVKSAPAPWLNPGLRKLMFERDKLKKIACRLRTDESWPKNNSVKNQVNEGIRLAKSFYYNTNFAADCGNVIMGKTPQLTRINAFKNWGRLLNFPSRSK